VRRTATTNLKEPKPLNQFPFTSQITIGLDIQVDAIRLLQLKKSRRQSEILHTAKLSLPQGLFSEGKINDWQLLTSLLAEQVENLGWQNLPTVIGLPAHLVRMQRLSLPAGLSAAEIEADIFLQLQQEMPGLSEPLAIDFSFLSAKEPDVLEVLYTAVREHYLAAYLQCLAVSGLNVKIVDVDCYALKRALTSENLPILHVKKHDSEFMVFDQHSLIFHQHWSAETSEENLLRLKDYWQIYAATFREHPLKQIILCVEEVAYFAYEKILRELADCEIVSPALAMSCDFAVAFGLAQRELPAW
jgi:type IV pilus assembly protein PilM